MTGSDDATPALDESDQTGRRGERRARRGDGPLSEQRPGLGEELLDEVEKGLGLIAASPGLGSPHPRRPALRRYLIRRFPYRLIYRELDDWIGVIAVAHCSREPDYSSDRSQC